MKPTVPDPEANFQTVYTRPNWSRRVWFESIKLSAQSSPYLVNHCQNAHLYTESAARPCKLEGQINCIKKSGSRKLLNDCTSAEYHFIVCDIFVVSVLYRCGRVCLFLSTSHTPVTLAILASDGYNHQRVATTKIRT